MSISTLPVSLSRDADNAIIESALAILENLIQKPDHYITSPADTRAFLKLKLSEIEHEVFAVLFLDNRHGVIQYQEMFRGTIDGASVHPREVVKEAFSLNAAALFTHNHPSGIAEPSKADEAITQRLKNALALVDIRVLDHLIIGADIVSFAERGMI